MKSNLRQTGTHVSRWMIGILVITLLIAPLMAGCSPAQTPVPTQVSVQEPTKPAQDQPVELQKVTLRIGRIPQAQGMTPVTEVMRNDELVEAAGKELGLDITVDWQDFPSGGAIRQAMSGGQLDIGSVGNTPTLIGISQGEPLHILSVAEGRVKFVLSLPPDSDIKTLDDLKGKTVGVFLATDLDFFWKLMLQSAFGTTDNEALGINVVGIKTLIQGAVPPEGIDAGITTETSFLVGQVDGLNKGLVNSYGYTEAGYDGPEGKGEGIELAFRKNSPYLPEGLYLHRNFWLATDDVVQNNPQAIVAFLVAQQRALSKLSTMAPTEVAALAQEYWQLDPEVAQQIWIHDLDSQRGWGWLTEGDLRAVVDQSSLMADAELIGAPLTWQQVIENTAITAELSRQAWEVTGYPAAAEFTAKDTNDLRGFPVWQADQWPLAMGGEVAKPEEPVELQKVTLRIGRIPQAQGMTPVTEVMRNDELVEAAGKELGLDITVDWQDFPSGGAIRQAMSGGQLDIGSVGNTPTLIGISQGEPLHILSDAEGRVKFVLSLPPDSDIKTLDDLKGKTVGVFLATDLDFFWKLMLQSAFGTTDNEALGINVVGIKTLIQGAVPPEGIDAGITTETSFLVGQVDGLNKGLVNSYGYTEAGYDGPEGKGEGIELAFRKNSPYLPEGLYLHRNFWLATDDVVQNNPQAIVAFLVAQQQALSKLSTMAPTEVAALAQEYWQLDPEVAQQIWIHDLDSQRGWGWLTEGDLRAVVDQSSLMADAELIGAPLTWQQVIENTAITAELSRQAWEVTGYPAAAEFTATDANDLRGFPVWQADQWPLAQQ